MAAVTESLQKALKYHEAGELEQAEALYQDIIRVDPGHADALHLLGVAAHQRADHRRGADYIGRAIARQSQSALYHSNLGVCYRAMNRIPDAVASFREAIRLQPGFAGARYNLAMALEAAGSVDEALCEYREVLRTSPEFVAALNNLGTLLSSLGCCDEAVDCYRHAIRRTPNSAEFHYNLANVLSRSGHCQEAVAEYRESIRLNANIPEAYNNLATALNSLGRHDEALCGTETRPGTAARLCRGAGQSFHDRRGEPRRRNLPSTIPTSFRGRFRFLSPRLLSNGASEVPFSKTRPAITRRRRPSPRLWRSTLTSPRPISVSVSASWFRRCTRRPVSTTNKDFSSTMRTRPLGTTWARFTRRWSGGTKR